MAESASGAAEAAIATLARRLKTTALVAAALLALFCLPPLLDLRCGDVRWTLRDEPVSGRRCGRRPGAGW